MKRLTHISIVIAVAVIAVLGFAASASAKPGALDRRDAASFVYDQLGRDADTLKALGGLTANATGVTLLALETSSKATLSPSKRALAFDATFVITRTSGVSFWNTTLIVRKTASGKRLVVYLGPSL